METSPETLSWDEIRSRLTKIMHATPPSWAIGGKDPCALAVIRLRDIARYCGIERADIYRIRRGDRPKLMKETTQVRLSWFFWHLDAGKLVKEKQADGKWRIIPRSQEPKVHADAQDARQAGVSAQIEIGAGGPRLRVLPK